MDFILTPLFLTEMDIFKQIVNSNYPMIKSFLCNKYQHQAYLISDIWIQKNFPKHTFYQFHQQGEKENPIGCISLKKIVDFAYIEYFFINKPHHQMGYGKMMQSLIEPKVLELKINKIRLLVHNKAFWAQRAYEKYGYHLLLSNKNVIRKFENGRIAPYFQVNHLLYEKIIQ